MILAFNLLFWSWVSAVLGGLYPKPNTTENAVPRWISLTACFIVLALQVYPDLISLVAWGWLFWCIRLLPTQALFTAVHGVFPRREDWITKLVPSRFESYSYGVVAGFIRTLPAIPSMLYIGNPFISVFFATGTFYYVAGWFERKYNLNHAVRYVEIFIGGLFALCLTN